MVVVNKDALRNPKSFDFYEEIKEELNK